MSVAKIQTNSDHLLNRKVAKSIRQLNYHQIHDVEFCARQGVVTLSGSIASFYLKQVVQAITAKVPGVARVINKIKVKI